MSPTARYICVDCLKPSTSDDTCADCQGLEFFDVESEQERDECVAQLRERAVQRRKKFVLAGQAAAILLSAGLLFVGLTVAAGLQSTAVEWGVKLAAVGLLAALWKAVVPLYRHYFVGRAEGLLAEIKER